MIQNLRLEFFFFENIISGIQLVYIIVHTFQRTSPEFFFYFRFSSSLADDLFYNTVSLKKPPSFYEPQLT